MKIRPPLHALLQDQLGTGTDHQILLIDPQLSACLVGVIRIEKQRQISVNILFIKSDPLCDQRFIHAVQIKQIQIIGPAMIAGDRKPMQPGLIGLARQYHRIYLVGSLHPAVLRQPVIRRLKLQLLPKPLAEQAAVIPQTDAVTGQIQSGQRIQEAGSQPSQTTVAQTGLRLQLLQSSQRLTRLFQTGLYRFIQT